MTMSFQFPIFNSQFSIKDQLSMTSGLNLNAKRLQSLKTENCYLKIEATEGSA